MSAIGRLQPVERPASVQVGTNLPVPVTRFVGRRQELASVLANLDKARLVSLVGAGGSGKSRLALEVAALAQDRFTDGVWLIELSQLSGQEPVAEAVARGVRVPQRGGATRESRLRTYLEPKRLLLLLDNCEHVVAEAAQLASDLLATCPDLRILTTSRERLRVGGEVLVPVPPLPTPPPGQELEPAQLLLYDSVALWLDRVHNVEPDFCLLADNAPLVAKLVAQLDGLPLALELAAGWSRILSPGEVSERVARDLGLVSRERDRQRRHMSLKAAVEWSYSLLDHAEQAVFRRLSIFPGSWSLPVMAAVCDIDPNEALDHVTALVEQSLVERVNTPELATRYRMLQTISSFGRERLTDHGELASTESRMLAHYAHVAIELAERIRLTGAECDLVWMDAELPNLERAVEIAMKGDHNAALRLARAMAIWADMRGHYHEAQRWLLGPLAAEDSDLALRSSGRCWLGVLEWALGDLEAALDTTLQAVREAVESDVQDAIASAQQQLAWYLVRVGRLSEAREAAKAARRSANRSEDPALRALCSFRMGQVELEAGDLAASHRHLEECLAITRPRGFTYSTAIVLLVMGRLALRQGDLQRARSVLNEALSEGNPGASPRFVALQLDALAEVEARSDNHERALQIAGAATGIRERFRIDEASTRRPPPVESLAGPLSMDSARMIVARGRAMSVREAVRYALDKGEAGSGNDRQLLDTSVAPLPTLSLAPAGTLLTGRELEIAKLVSAGLTNGEMALRLQISRRTVDAHLDHIRNKLAVRRRAEVASWVTRNGGTADPR